MSRSEKVEETKSARPRRRRWLRRIARTVLALVILGVVLRFVVSLVLPSVLAKVAKDYGLRCTYERLDVTFIGLDAELWHLVIAPEEGGEPFVRAEYCRADVATLELLRGRLAVRRVDADGLDLLIDRDADGTIPLLARLSRNAPPVKPPEKPPGKAGPPARVSFRPPLEVDAIRIQRLRARLRDRMPTPPVEAVLEMDLRISDIAAPERPARIEARLAMAPVFDDVRIDGTSTSADDKLEATLAVAFHGLHPKSIAGYLEPLGLRPVADDLSGALRMKIEASRFEVPRPEGGASKDRAPPEEAVRAAIALEDLRLSADGEEVLSLARMDLEAPDLRPAGVHLAHLAIRGARCEAGRSASGALKIAGLEIASAARTGEPAAPAGEGGEGTAVPPPAPAPGNGTVPAIRLDELRVFETCARFEDEGVDPAADLAIDVDDFSIRNIVLDPRAPGAEVEIAGRLAAPALARTIAIAGRAAPFAAPRTFDLALVADGIRPDALAPYLAAAGLESTFEDGALFLGVSGALDAGEEGLSADVLIHGPRLRDREDLFAFGGVRLAGIVIVPGRIDIDEIQVAGPRLAARREASGALALLGLRTAPRAAGGADAAPGRADMAPGEPGRAPPPAAGEGEGSAPSPRLTIGRILWKGIRMNAIDQAVAPAAHLSIEDAGLEITGLSVDLGAGPPPGTGAAPPAAKLRAWLTAPGIVRELSASGTVLASPRAPAAAIDLDLKSITVESIAPHLRAAGIEPALMDGSLRLHIGASADIGPAGVVASLAVEKVAFEDSGAELIGLDALRVKGASVRPGAIEVESVEIEGPRARVSRLENGSLLAAGFRIPAPAAVEAPRPEPAGPAAPAGAAESGGERPAEPPSVVLKSLRVIDAGVRFSDAAVRPAAAVSATAGVVLEGLVLGRDAPPASFQVKAKVEGSLDDLTLSGTIAPAPSGLAAKLDVAAAGLRAGPLASYFPVGASLALEDGRFRTHLEAALAPHGDGGQKAQVLASDLDLRDGAEGAPLLRMEAFRAVAGRIDLPGRVVAIDEVSLAGLEVEAERTSTGGLRMLGLSLEPEAAPDEPPEPRAPAAGPPAVDTPKPALERTRPAPLPLITLGKLDLEFKRIAFQDGSRDGAAPVTVAGLRLASVGPVELLGDEPEARPPVKLEITGRVDPILGSIRVGVEALPFAAEPALKVDVGVEGIRGEGILAVLPELREALTAAPLADGRFKGGLEASVKVTRRSPLEADLARGIGLDLAVKGIEFRDGPSGPVLAGLDELRVQGVKLDPAGNVRVRSLEIAKPAGKVVLEKDGLHVLGLVVKVPEPVKVSPAEKDAAAPAVQAAVAPAAPSPGSGPPKAPAGPPAAGEARIDRFIVSGIDFTAEDRSCDPPMVLPLKGLEADVKDLATRALVEEKEVRFNLLLKSGKTPLPSTAKGGLLGLAAGKEAAKLDEREVFDEIAVSGSLALHPRLRGWVKAGVSALDLTAFQGPASRAGVSIAGGIFETAAGVRFQKDGSLEGTTRTTFTDLDASEPAGGPIAKLLGLSAPLNTVIFLLRNEAGSIKVPLGVHVAAEGLSIFQVTEIAVKTLSTQIAKAVLNSPFRVAKFGMDLVPVPIGKGGKEKGAEEPAAIEFAPGDGGLAEGERRKIEALVERLRRDRTVQVTLRHEAGEADVARAGILANPAPAEAAALAQGLRERKADLLAARPAAAAIARGAISSRIDGLDREAISRLQAIDRELARTEDALDGLDELLRPGAGRGAPRRAREASCAVGRDRIEAVRAVLAGSGTPEIDGRIRVVPVRFAEVEGAGPGRVTVTVGVAKE